MIDWFERVFPSPQVLHALKNRIAAGQKVYLVGGVVRDALLGRDNHDLDFVVSRDVRKYARGVADQLGAPFYMMDLEHQTGRIVYPVDGNRRYYFDFAAMRGASIEEDLATRDFTVNAMALDLDQPERLIDPLKGAQDLKDKLLRACRPSAFVDDPVRLLRAVRQSVMFQMRLEPATIQALKAASDRLSLTSAERRRDEFFRILEGRRAVAAVRILDQFKLLRQLVPELIELKGAKQTTPHTLDVWDHTLATLDWLERLFDLLVNDYHEDKSAALLLGMATLQLGRYREQYQAHFNSTLIPGRSERGLLFLAALLHDAGKPLMSSTDSSDRTHFYEHEMAGAEIASVRGRALVLSNLEVERLCALVRHHMRIHNLAASRREVSRRSIYRLFRAVGEGGIDLCLLSLADTLATYGVTISPADWDRELSVCRRLLDAWFEHYDLVVNPPRLIRGSDLIHLLHLQPGPQIGRVLETIHEAQASGLINSREEAIELAKSMVKHTMDEEESASDGAKSS